MPLFRCLSGLVDQFVEDNRCEVSDENFSVKTRSDAITVPFLNVTECRSGYMFW